jgi:hypothetical protein
MEKKRKEKVRNKKRKIRIEEKERKRNGKKDMKRDESSER